MAENYSGRGVYLFPSTKGCPIDSSVNCNRIALDDDDTKVTLDTKDHKIIFINNRNYDKKTIVADVVLHGRGIAKGGETVPLSLHGFIYKHHNRWQIRAHAHAPVSGRFDQMQFPPYTISVTGTASSEILLTPEEAMQTISDPSFSARLASELIELSDNRVQSGDTPDLTVSIGLGKLAVPVVRVQFNIEDSPAVSLEQSLSNKNWSINIQPLNKHVPVNIVRRDLFLYGLHKHSLLTKMVNQGFGEKEPLVIGSESGKGYILLGKKREPFPNAKESATRFLNNSFIGEILAWQQQKRLSDGL